MLSVCHSGSKLCDGIPRREFLRLGGFGLTGLSLPGFCAHQVPGQRRVRSVVQFFMWGGPAQHETFDLKPNAPIGIRPISKPIATATPGIRIGAHLPLLAQCTNDFAILRSVTHTGVNHGTSAYHMLTGHIHFTPGTLRHPTPNDFPHVGCAVARFGPPPRDVPPYVALPSLVRDGDAGEVPGQGPGMLGSRYAPFQVFGDPTRRDFALETLRLPEEVNAARLTSRIGLHGALDRHGERLALARSAAVDANYEQAFRLLQSRTVRRAFQLRAEPDALRERYGWHTFGQSCLIARRLVEAGVPIITVYWNAPSNTDQQSWDTHHDEYRRLRDHVLPPFDRALSAFLDDLKQRGLLAETMLLWYGEFGRSPRVNRAGGREHWGFVQSALVAGGGVRGGQVYGSSDRHAAYAAELPVSPDDLAATVLEALGVPLGQEMADAQGRPMPVCCGKPVRGLY